MPTWPEARAAEAERKRREQRYFYPEHLGARCVGGCGQQVPIALVEAGEHGHATCSAEFRRLLAAANAG